MLQNWSESYGDSTGIKSTTGFRQVSIRILHHANLGTSKYGFLRQVSKILLDFSGCDSLSILTQDAELCNYSYATQRPLREFMFEVIDTRKGDTAFDTFRSHETAPLAQEILNLLSGASVPKIPIITNNSSIWIEDVVSLDEMSREYPQLRHLYGSLNSAIYKSILAIPFVIDDKSHGILLLKSIDPDFFTYSQVELYESHIQNLGNAIAARRAKYLMMERVKELTCLYGIAQLARDPELSTASLLAGAVELLRPAWQYPECTSGRIFFDGQEYVSSNFNGSGESQRSELSIDEKVRGYVQVIYNEEKPMLYEGPFLREERHLIDTIGAEISSLLEMLEIQHQQERLKGQLRHADRLATIGQLAAGVAHELNEPLGSILGYAQLSLKTQELPLQVEQDLNKIVESSLHAREVVKKLLTFARQVPTTSDAVNLNELIKTSLYFLSSRMKKEQIELVHDLDDGLPEIQADRSQLHQVLVNLAVNAMQAMEGGGTLTLKTGYDQNHVFMYITDNGCGMDDELLHQIFIPFFTTKEIGKGTGLGLSVVHGIVTSHGGEIEVHSVPGEGSTFKVILPIYHSSGDSASPDHDTEEK
ncbi:MAG TPA: ATP-binding protein [bacterium]|jgi:signal transduction histidine kinase